MTKKEAIRRVLNHKETHPVPFENIEAFLDVARNQ